MVGLVGVEVSLGKFSNFCLRFSVGWLGWLGCWFLCWQVSLVSCLSSWFVVSGWLVGLVGVEVSLGKFSNFCLRFSVGWLGWLGCWFFELVVFSSWLSF